MSYHPHQQMNFGAPYQQSHSPQPGYGPPPGQFQQPPYPHQQQGYPPQGQYPPQGPYPQQHGYPQGPPAGTYGQLPPQQGFGYPGQQTAYGTPAPPSPGYDLRIPIQAGSQGAINDAKSLYAAMDGVGTDEKRLIQILSKPDPNQMRVLVHEYDRLPKRKQVTLEDKVDKETSGYFRDGLLALVRGPLGQDVFLLNKGMKGAGTKESFLNDVLCCRSNADIHAIKALYREKYGKDLVQAVKGELSLKTETLFEMILAGNRAEEYAPYDHGQVERDAHELQRAMSNMVDQLTVCSILTSRSNTQIRGIAQFYQQTFHDSLSSRIKSKFSGHMQEALLLIVGRAVDGAMTNAEELEATMKGLGTKDELLVQRVVRLHWDREALDQAKRAYKHKYKTDLTTRVKSETRGDFERLLIACLT